MQRVALIGNPLARRHSQVMHNAAFADCGIDASYELREIDAAEVGAFADAARSPDWLGFQVTAPYKQSIMQYLDEVTDDAAAIGAVNTVESTDGLLRGLNTDAAGFRSAIEHELVGTLADRAVAVIGAGGAAHAVVHACITGGAASVMVGNRTPDRAGQLVERFAGHRASIGAAGLDSAEFVAALQRATVVVNASTVGMTSDNVPCDVSVLPADAKVYDCVYTPLQTPLLRAASDRGLAVANGLGMLVEQARIAFERFTGVAGTSAVMRESLSGLLDTQEGP